MQPKNIAEVPDAEQPSTTAEAPLRGLAEDHPAGHRIAAHSHDTHQVIHAASGILRVTSEAAVWVVPPGRALWMPAGRRHALRCHTSVALRTIYLREAPPGFGNLCRVCGVPPLLREILMRLASDPAAAGNPHLRALLCEELTASEALPLTLPQPADSRLKRLTARLLADPQDSRGLDAWAGELGLSRRNLIRRFRAETGLTFREWRRQARLLAALEHLGAGQPVTAVAFEVGYDSVSAFIAAFRTALGTTPGRYFADAGRSG
ncbi:AraC family transcriptional regulator [Algihabitans albus]|uniref:AraC family transcriptional regulator n=1 Tax=Algihabitans albus TaxID=2164067 RepID=UPI000E5D77AB|nr:helix-turn-helix transcriptional regulator [Algihabitans albus]